ncbi:MAG: hypothetical protein LBN71_07305, partial [Tannerella sp.]|nr:hypothetical protein [Tannerella sp.]
MTSMFACGKSEEDVSFNIEKKSVVFTAEQSEQVISFTSNVDVKVTSSQSWCTASVISGSSSSVIS